jgi:hypothetical protein
MHRNLRDRVYFLISKNGLYAVDPLDEAAIKKDYMLNKALKGTVQQKLTGD